MLYLIIPFLAGSLLLMLLAEDERLEDYADRMEINRMADRSRSGWNHRRRRKYTEAVGATRRKRRA